MGPGSTVVEHFTHYPKIKGSDLATDTRFEKVLFSLVLLW